MAEIRRSPVEVGSLSLYFIGFQHHPRWLGMGFQPSTVFVGFDPLPRLQSSPLGPFFLHV